MLVHWLRFAALAALLIMAPPLQAHEGHDHDKAPQLNLPVAPRVIAVTPELELVGVASGRDRLTIFLHAFATNEPIKGARISVTHGADSTDAEPKGDGVFSLTAAWLAGLEFGDLVFSITLGDGSQDLLTGRLQKLPSSALAAGVAAAPVAWWSVSRLRDRPDLLAMGAGGLIAGVLLSQLLAGTRLHRAQQVESGDASRALDNAAIQAETDGGVTSQRGSVGRRASAAAIIALGAAVAPSTVEAGGSDASGLPSIPSTMATDLAQRMPDGTLFVPKATQHLLSMRTILTARGAVPRSVELPGTIVAGPEHFGRVQPGRPGRIEAAPGGFAYIGKRVEKGQLLGYVQNYIAAADQANIDSQIAETEARIEKNRMILSRYEKSPGSVPQVKVDEVRGELDALTRKRAELLPAADARTPVLAPISGVVSVANATIGQIVESRDILFEIVDPSQFWVEAITHDANVAQGIEKATVVGHEIGPMSVEFAGRGLALRQQATVLSFKIAGKQDSLAIGMPVKVILQTTAKVDGFVVPASAIVRGPTGLPIVWTKTEPERFEPQLVKFDTLDGTSVTVTSGLKEDMRIVTDGASLLNQVR